MNAGPHLEDQRVATITGEYRIPGYQRGYRWGREEVRRLLDDIYASADRACNEENYCLQPVVLRRTDSAPQTKRPRRERESDEQYRNATTVYEVIDGQQRLTTLYLIRKYIHSSLPVFKEPDFTLTYETRPQSADFLKTLDPARAEENVDFWFMSEAYKVIAQWFSEHGDDPATMMTVINSALVGDANRGTGVRILRYEVDETEDPVDLFTRLNIGKIPLTNAELVRALFLSQTATYESDAHRKEKIQDEIAMQWDRIESELQDDSFWYFLSRDTEKSYGTRIDLILDLIARRSPQEKDQYATFFDFDRAGRESGLERLWADIQRTYLTLRGWWEDRNVYHKVGYLIATGDAPLADLLKEYRDKTKTEFEDALDRRIRDSIDFFRNSAPDAEKDYASLSYEREGEKEKLRRLLLLFNVESARREPHAARFSFSSYNSTKAEGRWSLEHIHAQHADDLHSKDEWREWLRQHAPSVRSLGGEEQARLAQRMWDAAESEKLDSVLFNELQREAVRHLSENPEGEEIHTLDNLALIQVSGNASLSNSAFDVKRQRIVDLDCTGHFIPFCTKMVFFKYYTMKAAKAEYDAEEKDGRGRSGNVAAIYPNYWTMQDRKCYMDAMREVLDPYLPEGALFAIDEEESGNE